MKSVWVCVSATQQQQTTVRMADMKIGDKLKDWTNFTADLHHLSYFKAGKHFLQCCFVFFCLST